MKLIDKYNEVKNNNNNNSIILIKSGIFYKTFNDDAYILNYLFNYKINKMSSYVMIGFPEKAIEKVTERLLKEKVSFVVIEDNKEIASDKSSSINDNYKVLLDTSCKSNNIETEIERIKNTLDILKRTNSIDKIISEIKEII